MYLGLVRSDNHKKSKTQEGKGVVTTNQTMLGHYTTGLRPTLPRAHSSRLLFADCARRS